MQIHRSYHDIPPEARGASVAMGNFDGVHLGHQAVLDIARQRGDDLNAPLGIITFEPHPRSLFAPDAPPFRLMNARARAHRFAKLGVQHLFELPFNKELASLSAEAFCTDVLHNGLGLKHLVVGEDFCFGKGRSGNVDTLRDFGEKLGFEVSVAKLVADDLGVYSSSAIRAALAGGQPEHAAKMLGHWHRIEGIVEHGDKRGRDLGFPTANIPLRDLHYPRFGVYAVLVDVLSGDHQGSYHGVASLGSRPTFGENIPNLEVMLFDFDGDLYGAELSVALVEFQRPELKYEGIEPLIKQMHQDVARAKEVLSRHG